jgi:predicted ATPase
MKFVITGGPSVGKTTIVTGLEAAGYKVVHEVATQVIKEGQFLPWENRKTFQAEVLRRQQALEAINHGSQHPVILDRGLFDGEAYYLYDKLPVPESFTLLDASQYALAFLIEPLPFFEETDVRRENLKFTREISIILEHCYESRQVKVIRVPAMPPVERIEFVKLKVETHHLLLATPRAAVPLANY